MSKFIAGLLRLSKYVVFSFLFLYFIIRVIKAVGKLQKGAIGTSISKQSSHILLYPSISVCTTNNQVMRYVADGKLYESEQSYINSMENNVTTNYALGSGPNINDIVQSISTLNVNGTFHEMSGQSRDII